MQKIDVFLKSSNLETESVENIKRWIFIFLQKSKYNIKLVIPEKCNNTAISLFSNIKIVNDIEIAHQYNFQYKIFYDKLTSSWQKTGIANLTCYKNAKTSFFWNIDADDTYFTLDCFDDNKLLDKLEQVENISIKNNYHAISLDFYRIINYHATKWSDHWSFGICFIKNDIKTINKIVSNMEIIDAGFGINSDHIFDTIRKNKKIKIITFVIKNSKLIHPAINKIGCPKVVHKYNIDNKETYSDYFKFTNNYTEVLDDYIIV
jgi:hypothetical protein